MVVHHNSYLPYMIFYSHNNFSSYGSQIEQSLEELAPACTLELLGMPDIPENAERRQGAIAALRELLRQGLDVEASCQVQDWSCFLSQALNRLMAAEIIDLLSWDDLAVTRKNKKSLESQNQRVVIDFNCFYLVLIAYIALGFLSKQMELVSFLFKIFVAPGFNEFCIIFPCVMTGSCISTILL